MKTFTLPSVSGPRARRVSAQGVTFKLMLTLSVRKVPHLPRPHSGPAAQASGIWRDAGPGTLILFKERCKEISLFYFAFL